MKAPSVFRRIVAILVVAAGWSSIPANSAEFYNIRTNYVDTPVTNLIEVRMPRPVFVNHYRTNWVEQTRTNVQNVYSTNRVVVDRFRTNFVDAFRTNLKTLQHTNQVVVQVTRTNYSEAYLTNVQDIRLTNDVVIHATRTNYVEAYKTNFEDLNVTNEVAVKLVRTNHVDAYRTNWQTIALVQTNWVTQKITNIVRVDAAKPVPVQPIVQSQPTASRTVGATGAASAVSATDEPVIEVSRTAKPPENNLVEVELKVRWPADTADAPPVSQWRIESENGAVLSFGNDQEFRKDLPVGSYKVEAKLQRDTDSPSFVLRGTLSDNVRDAVVQQRTNRTKLAAN
jgi:hypothetical protein